MADFNPGFRYRIIKEIDKGGMSNIYTAFNKHSRSTVAIKVLREDMIDDPDVTEHFNAEAEVMAKLHHRNIVKILDTGEYEGRKYIVMEYIPGITLKEKLQIYGRLSTEECVDYAMKLCNALNYAHHKGVIHRDLKPGNVLLRENGAPVIIDFGIAQAEDKQQSGEQVLGSVQYFSPEQAKGKETDNRTDIYSLGVMLYELATGRLPFDGEDQMEIALKHLHQRPDDPSELVDMPRSFARIIMKAMEKDPENRYRTAGEMYRDLERCLTETDGKYVRLAGDEYEAPTKEEKKRTKTRMITSILILAGTMIVITVGVLLMTGYMNARDGLQQVFMPYLVESTEADAKMKLAKLGKVPKVSYEANALYEKGTVIAQLPEAGTVIETNDVVSIVVSTEGSTYMPEVRGMSQQEALAVLNELGLNRVIINEDAEAEAGVVTSQSPERGDQVELGATVILTAGAEKLTIEDGVPPLEYTHYTYAAAKAAEVGFKHVILYTDGEYDEDISAGVILSQSPEMGMKESSNAIMYLHMAEDKSWKRYSLSLNFTEEELLGENYVTVTAVSQVGTATAEVGVFAGESTKLAEMSGEDRKPVTMEMYYPVEQNYSRINIYVNGRLRRTATVLIKEMR